MSVWDLSAYRPHPYQTKFHEAQAKVKVLACGRRWGKDRACIYEVLRRIPELMKRNSKIGGLVPLVHIWCVAPTYALTYQMWCEYNQFIPHRAVSAIRESTRRIELFDGKAVIEMKTAMEPERLVSVGLDLLVVTEAGLVNEESWTQSLRPTLSSPGRLGEAIFNGTPKGKNWFYCLAMRGAGASGGSDVRSWNYPTWGSTLVWRRLDIEAVLGPFPRAPSHRQFEEAQRQCVEMALVGETDIIPQEIEEARRDMPEPLFRQEYGAEFLEDAGSVFRRVESCIGGEPQPPQAGRSYVMGVDLAKQHDYSVIFVADAAARAIVHFDCFCQVDWPVQKARIIETSRRYNGAVAYVDATGVGEPIVDDLASERVPVEGVKLSAQMKRDLVNRLAINIEQQRIRYPCIEQLLGELKAYAYERAKSGALRTAAPSGSYDDCVIALALCVHGLDAYGPGERLEPERYAAIR